MGCLRPCRGVAGAGFLSGSMAPKASMFAAEQAPDSVSKGGLVDAAFVANIKKRRASAPVLEKPLDASIKRKLYDNFKDMSDQELYGNVDSEGWTLRERLEERVAKHQENPKAFSLGAPFYKSLRATFRSSSSSQKKLASVEVGESVNVDPRLMQAAIKFKKTGNKAVFNAVLQHLNAVNVQEVVGICQCGLEIRPAASPDQLRYGRELMELFKRLDVPAHFPEQTALMLDLFDQVLEALYASALGEHAKPSKFLESHSDIAYLVLPRESVERLLQASTWTEVHGDLAQAVERKIGMSLFGSGLRSVQNEVVERTLEESADALFNSKDKVTPASLLKAKQAAYTLLTGKDVLKKLEDKRVVQITYLFQKLSIPVKTLNDHIDHVFAARWKSNAVRAKIAPALFGEMGLSGAAPLADYADRLDSKLYKDNKVVRESMETSFSEDHPVGPGDRPAPAKVPEEGSGQRPDLAHRGCVLRGHGWRQGLGEAEGGRDVVSADAGEARGDRGRRAEVGAAAVQRRVPVLQRDWPGAGARGRRRRAPGRRGPRAEVGRAHDGLPEQGEAQNPPLLPLAGPRRRRVRWRAGGPALRRLGAREG
ncbi:unnamed protein product [Prorocentrum cordatum]|uniref:Uncharacterized protein n=1 Tax=Prorocentrum cordatum TaxID=2364126 RepID=A0ABN9UTC2_9DINO|nr:unnamed protein product [Polarella glacialis]